MPEQTKQARAKNWMRRRRDAGALIALARLHGGEEQASRQHQEADKALENEEHVAAGTRHHQHAAGEEEEGLCLT